MGEHTFTGDVAPFFKITKKKKNTVYERIPSGSLDSSDRPSVRTGN